METDYYRPAIARDIIEADLDFSYLKKLYKIKRTQVLREGNCVATIFPGYLTDFFSVPWFTRPFLDNLPQYSKRCLI